MMDSPSLDSALMGFGIAVMIIWIIVIGIAVAMLVLGISMLSKRKQRIAALEQAKTHSYAMAKVADMRFFNDASCCHYEYALHFAGNDNLMHRAFLHVKTTVPMTLQVGSEISVTVFPQPMMQPSVDALSPDRGADGMLPPFVAECTWLDRPIDETGTVMLEADYIAAVQQAQRKNRTAVIVGWILIGIVLVRVLSIILYMLSAVLRMLF